MRVKMMWIFELINWRVCLILMLGILLIPLIFLPPITWDEVLNYFYITPILEWIGQLGWVFFFGALGGIGYAAIKELFG